MLTNRKIKKKVTEELKPEITFEEFCNFNGVEYSSNTIAHSKPKALRKILISVCVSVALVLCIGLPFAFSNKSTEPGLIIYGDQDVSYEVIQADTLLADDKLFMIDLDKCEKYSYIRRAFPTQKASLTVGYTIKDVVYGFEYEDNFYAYEFDYIIRSYSGYKFSNIDVYSNPSSFVSYGDSKFGYTLDDSKRNVVAFVSFKKGNFDYYVNVRSFEDFTEINDTTLEIFIENVLSD